MRKTMMMLMCFMIVISSIEACVTYNPAKRTYTVDESGNVKLSNKKK